MALLQDIIYFTFAVIGGIMAIIVLIAFMLREKK